jgi:hypothetical protein
MAPMCVDEAPFILFRGSRCSLIDAAAAREVTRLVMDLDLALAKAAKGLCRREINKPIAGSMRYCPDCLRFGWIASRRRCFGRLPADDRCWAVVSQARQPRAALSHPPFGEAPWPATNVTCNPLRAVLRPSVIPSRE